MDLENKWENNFITYNFKGEAQLAFHADYVANNIVLESSEQLDFWKFLKPNKYPLLHKEILRLYSMFGSAYICESAFSKFKLKTIIEVE